MNFEIQKGSFWARVGKMRSSRSKSLHDRARRPPTRGVQAMQFLSDVFSHLPPPFNLVIGVMLIICVTSLVSDAIKQVGLYANRSADRELKREMIEAGYTPDDAARLAEMKVTEAYEPQKTAG